MAAIPTITLPSGAKVPIIAYGTGTLWFKDPDMPIDRRTVDGIKTAIDVGYRHLDGAQMYNTEGELGAAMTESGVPRSEFFLTTKAVTVENVEGALEASLTKLKTNYVDLYMIHDPFSAETPAQLQEAWRGMEQCVQRGLARDIGLSNCTIKHLSTVLEVATIKPSINQIEMHPYLQQPDLVAYLREEGIQIEGFASLTPLKEETPDAAGELCAQLARKYGVSKSAILLRWVIDQGAVVVTTSGQRARLDGYLKEVPSFSLASEEVQQISLSTTKRHRGFFADEFKAISE